MFKLKEKKACPELKRKTPFSRDIVYIIPLSIVDHIIWLSFRCFLDKIMHFYMGASAYRRFTFICVANHIFL